VPEQLVHDEQGAGGRRPSAIRRGIRWLAEHLYAGARLASGCASSAWPALPRMW